MILVSACLLGINCKYNGDNNKNEKVSFNPAQKLAQLYERGLEKKVRNPEEYAVKNWIVRAQGFLISCAVSYTHLDVYKRQKLHSM